MADHVFYRTFDVGNCTILDKIDDKIAGVEGIFLSLSCMLVKFDS